MKLPIPVHNVHPVWCRSTSTNSALHSLQGNMRWAAVASFGLFVWLAGATPLAGGLDQVGLGRWLGLEYLAV